MSDAGPDAPQFVPLKSLVAEQDAAAAAAAAGEGGEDAGDQLGPPTKTAQLGEMMRLDSLCMGCGEQGATNLLLTRIPFFRDVILMAFECEHCGLRNSEVQSAEVQEKGCRFEVHVTSMRDLSRQVVKSDRASAFVPELQFEIPPATQRGVFTTIEGLLARAADNLRETQPMRRAMDAESADAVDAFLTKLEGARDGTALPFTLILDDPSGNSFVENLEAPRHDPGMKLRYYARSEEQNHSMGMYAESSRAGMALDDEGRLVDADSASASPSAGGGGGGGSASGDAASSSAAAASSTSEEGDGVDGDTGGMVGSGAHTMSTPPTFVASSMSAALGPASVGARAGAAARTAFAASQPTRFVKGGALIKGETSRNGLTESVRRRGGAVRGSGGALEGIVFDSSTSDGAKEVMRFPVDCYACSTRGECRMVCTDVPHFKEVVIMAFTCEACGWRDVEVKGGGAVPPHGTITELRYVPGGPGADRDLVRDVIKSDTAAVEIPELDFVLEHGSLGGMYTTVEGLLTAMRDRLVESDPFASSAEDGADADGRAAPFRAFVASLDACIAGARPFTMRLVDPMANTWVYSPTAPDPDPVLIHSTYERSEQENLDLGLLDMKTEDYGEDKEEAAAVDVGAGAGVGTA